MIVNQESLTDFANEVLRECITRNGKILALHGDLGAGKTTFVNALAQAMGVTEQAISPTFIVYRIYGTTHEKFKKLIHIDAYRLEGENDAKVIKLHEVFLDQDALVCIEWPENIGEGLPKDALHLYFTYHSETEREISWQSKTKN